MDSSKIFCQAQVHEFVPMIHRRHRSNCWTEHDCDLSTNSPPTGLGEGRASSDG